jgi:hypothetical protein
VIDADERRSTRLIENRRNSSIISAAVDKDRISRPSADLRNDALELGVVG